MGRLKRVAVAGVLVGSVSTLAGCGWFHNSAPGPAPSPRPTATAPAPSPSQTTPPPPAPRYRYTVEPRDYMGGIAQGDGVPLGVLEAANPQIPDPHWIYPGENVWLPQPLQSEPPKLPLPPAPLSCDGNIGAVQGQASAYAGHGVGRFVLTNNSNQTCTLDGFPSVGLTDASGATLPLIETDGSGQATQGVPAPVTLAPGAKAQFRVEWSDVTNDPAGCVVSSAVTITLPGQKTPIVIPGATVRACPEGDRAVAPQLSVGAVTGLLDF